MVRRASAFAFLLLLGPAVGIAQESYLELMRSDLRTQKTAVITAVMNFSDAEGKTFWPIYREYELELGKLTDGQVDLLKAYAASYDKMDDAKAKDLATRWFKFQDDRMALRKKYFKKVESAMSASTAARFLQIENQIGLLIDLQIAQELPLLEKAAGAVQQGESKR